MIDAAGGPLLVTLRFIALAATVGVLGAWVFGQFVVMRLTGAVASAHRVPLQEFSVRAAVWCATVLALATCARLAVGASADVEGTVTAALRTDAGPLLATQAAVAAAAAVALRHAPRAGAWSFVASLLVAALAVIPPFLAHAGAAAELRGVSLLVDTVHIAAAGGWVGALGLLCAAVLRERRSPAGPAHAAALIVAFHPVAMVAATAVFVTGLATAWLRMGVPEGIASPTYSGLFVAKLLLVGVTGALGAGHAKLAKRRAQSVDVDAVGRSLAAECLLAGIVLALTAVLVGTEPIG